MSGKARVFRTIGVPVALTAFASGCITGIIQKPDLSKLAYDQKGVLRYDGKPAEVRYVLPWYEDMWPDSAPEWIFTIATAGVTGVIASSGGGGDNGSDSGGGASTTSTSSPSGGSTRTSTSSSGQSSSGSRSSQTPIPPPPPPPDSDEKPF